MQCWCSCRVVAGPRKEPSIEDSKVDRGLPGQPEQRTELQRLRALHGARILRPGGRSCQFPRLVQTLYSKELTRNALARRSSRRVTCLTLGETARPPHMYAAGGDPTCAACQGPRGWSSAPCSPMPARAGESSCARPRDKNKMFGFPSCWNMFGSKPEPIELRREPTANNKTLWASKPGARPQFIQRIPA